ncbi:MAG: glycosyltransferase family 4 protein [Desulfobacter sp.]
MADKNIKRITFLASPVLRPNMEAVLKNFALILKDNFELHLITASYPENETIRRLYKINLYSQPKIDLANLVYSFMSCWSFLRKKKTDIMINISQPATLGVATAVVSRFSSAKSVVRMTGVLDEYKAIENPWKKIKAWILHKKISSIGYKQADHIISVGDKLIHDLHHIGINDSKVSTLPQPFNNEKFLPVGDNEKEKLKKQLNISTEKKILLFVGRLSMLKGADRFLEVVEGVARKTDRFQFCVVGEGEYLPAFKKFPASLVYCAGRVPHGEVFKFFQVADLLLFPSRTEGLPNTVLEALSCKVPVIASPVGDITNWVSMTSNDPQIYIKYILKEKWILDKLNDSVAFDSLKSNYIELFKRIICGADGQGNT